MKFVLCLGLLITSMQLVPIASAQASSDKVNVAIGKVATSSFNYAGMGPEKAIDGNDATRWATEPKGSDQWLMVNLGTPTDFNEFYVASEKHDEQHLGSFKIEGSNDGNIFDVLYESEDKSANGGYPFDQNIELKETVRYQYVRITINKLIDNAYESISLREFGILAPTEEDSTPKNVNLALNQPVSVSAQYSTMPGSKLTDDDPTSRWSSESAPTQWAYVDLGAEYKMNKFQMVWESDNVYASSYNIYVSNDKENWGTPVVAKVDNAGKISTDLIKTPATGRYVKLEVTKMYGYPSVSCSDFQVVYSDETSQDPLENVALGKQVSVHDQEAASLGGANLVDGDTTTKASRWAATQQPTWAYIDLGAELNVTVVKLFWERRNTNDYELQIASELSSPMKEDDWTTVKDFDTYTSSKDQKVVLDKTQKARYVRLKINHFEASDQDNIENWNSVSLYEMQVYGGNPKASISDVVNAIEIESPAKGDQKLNIDNLPVYDDYTITYNGTDYEQVIDSDLTIYEPVVDTKVKASFKVTDNEKGTYKFKEVELTVPGTYAKTDTDNAMPSVLPELREWKGNEGNFALTDSSRIVYTDSTLKETAQTFADDFKELTGKTLEVVQGEANTGDISFSLTKKLSKGLKDEGYMMNITDRVLVEAETTTGAYWSTRTILQILKNNNYETIPCGITRDYPLYKVRGFILDVGRKPFTLDYIQQITKEMSWYKLNDFQIHLNDNYIFLEEYTAMGKDPMQAYSGFRLESDVKKGGNGGLNQQDLTSTDEFYTKDEFRDFIQESRVRGVNIVPEIDTPAHSLALTKVRPDLRVGTNGRDNDHLNLTTKYDESLGFVKSIFNEYLTIENPVFDDKTIVHIGADEYNASSSAYRRFSNDMIEFVKNTGRTPRIWGSLSAASEGEEVRGEGTQINLWNFGYANMDKMYDLGFELINCNDGQYYIVPNAGYYGEYLNHNNMYNLNINSISGVSIPAGDKQMVGGAFAVWNDMVDRRNNGVSEYDVFERIKTGLPLYAANSWGKGSLSMNDASAVASELGHAPGTNFAYDIKSATDNIAQYNMDNTNDASMNNHELKNVTNAAIETVDFKQTLKLNGEASYAETGYTTIGLNNNIRVKVKRLSENNDEQILFESPYGSIKAVQKDTGKVGFSREIFDYSFNYSLPVNEWVELEFKNELNKAYLYVNGELKDVLGDGETIQGRPLLATMMFPIQYIGSTSNAFIGYVDDVRITTDADYASTMKLDYAVLTANAIMEADSATTDTLAPLVQQAGAIIHNYQPDQAEIESLTTALETAISGIDYEKADYSKINIYKSLILDDLSVFTDNSVSVLESVLSSIRMDLPKSMQKTVVGYEKALAAALHGLELKTEANVNYVDSSLITATASSYQHDGSDPKNVLDDNTSSIWHTDWNITTLPHWIDFQFDEAMSVNALSYLPRQSGTNGNITGYKIQVSDDGTNYSDIKSGTWANNATEKSVSFDAVTTKHLRLVVTASVGNFGTASEIKIGRADVAADFSGLQALNDKAKLITNIGYTHESWDALQTTIQDAEKLLENTAADANDVEMMKRSLSDVMMKLTLETTAVNKDALESAIKEAEQLLENEDKYVSSYIEKLRTVYDEAVSVYESENATEVQVIAITAKLKEVIANPILREDTTLVKSILANTIAKANKAKESESFATLAPAVQKQFNTYLQEAIAVYDNADASVQTVLSAWNHLAFIMQYLDFQADKGLLEELITSCADINLDDYSIGVEEFVAALEQANAVLDDENALQLRIDEAYTRLFAAKAGLGKDTLNKDLLEQLITLAQQAKENAAMYNQNEAWNAFLTALTTAESINADKNATQADINSAVASLAAAYENIRLLPDEALIQVVKNFVATARTLQANAYTPEAYAAIISVVDEAEAMINQNNYPEAEFKALLVKIDEAYAQMENGKLETPVENPTTTPKQPATATASTKATKPKTGDQTNMMYMITLLGAAGAIGFYSKRKASKK